jgi:cyclophilin family peptidyl-prolyl cis-trans isomerase
MARLSGKPDSATSQFFINVADNRRLDERQDDGAAYAVFGRVIAGMDVVDAIRAVKVRDNGHYEVSQPVEPVVIKSVRRLSAEEGKKIAAEHDAKKPG